MRRSGLRASLSAPVQFLDDSRRGVRIGRRQRSAKDKNARHAALRACVLARQDLAQAQVDALAENATKIITDNGGTIAKTETWGLRSLAYRIQKNRKAHYVMLDIDAPAPAIAELERQTQINEDVIRYMTVRVDAHEQGPSAMMRRNERSDREAGKGGRGSERDDRAPAAPRRIRSLRSSMMARPFFRRRKSCPFSGNDDRRSISVSMIQGA